MPLNALYSHWCLQCNGLSLVVCYASLLQHSVMACGSVCIHQQQLVQDSVMVLCFSFPTTASFTTADCVYLLLANRLFTEGEHERLLSFPAQFNQDLTQWLQKRLASVGSNHTRAASLRRLTWLHDLRRKEYAAASRTLADVTNNNEVRTFAQIQLATLVPSQ